MKTVSIILPVYNVEKYVLRCLNSIIGQSFKDFELIVIDDCGTDNSIVLCQKNLAKSSIVYKIIYNDKNIGVSECRRIGVKNSNSEYILFVDSDDWIHSNTLEKLCRTIRSHNADFVSAMAKNYWEADGTFSKISNIQPGIYSAQSYLDLFFSGKNNLEIWARLFKRELINNTAFPKKAIHEDMLMLPYIIKRSKKIVHINEYLYFYLKRDTDTSITGSKPKNIQGFLFYLDKIRNDFSNICGREYIHQKIFLYHHLLESAYSCSHFSTNYINIQDELKYIQKLIRLNDIRTLKTKLDKKQILQLLLLKHSCYLFYRSYRFALTLKKFNLSIN